MDKAREILEQMPDVKIGLDSFYGQQTVLNALNKALNIHNVVESAELVSNDEQGTPIIDKDGTMTCNCYRTF